MVLSIFHFPPWKRCRICIIPFGPPIDCSKLHVVMTYVGLVRRIDATSGLSTHVHPLPRTSPLKQNTISILSRYSPRGKRYVRGDRQGRGTSSRQGRKTRIVDDSEWRGRENVQQFCRCVGGQRKPRAVGPNQWPASGIEGNRMTRLSLRSAMIRASAPPPPSPPVIQRFERGIGSKGVVTVTPSGNASFVGVEHSESAEFAI